MLQYIDSQDFTDAAAVLAGADPETARLVQAMEGCFMQCLLLEFRLGTGLHTGLMSLLSG